MKISLNFLFFLFWAASVFSQAVHFESNDWHDPAIFEKNQTKPHTRLISFDKPEDALETDISKSPWLLSLNGTWKFLLVDHPDLTPAEFYKTGYNTKTWKDIPVPSNWEMEGFGHPKFRNKSMTIETAPPDIPERYNPTACYKRSFKLPAGWKNREVFLRFEGVKSASYVWINGQKVGYNQGGFEPAEYNITSYLKPGLNDLAVQVLRYSDGAFLENQDMWRFSGIFRDVNLISKPKVYIHDYFVSTKFDEDYLDADMHLTIDVCNLSGSNKNDYSTEILLLDDKKKVVPGTSVSRSAGYLANGEVAQVSFLLPVESPLQWSAEKPNLYTLVMTLKNPEGKIEEVVAKKMGFRQTELKDGTIWVNGAQVKFNGINSHMHHPDHGQAVPLETLRKDLLLMKQFNINLVRASHYPPTPEYMDMADELGMYVVVDAGIECHFNLWLSEMPEWKNAFVDRGVKMVYRDRNHPSLVFWSAGNEAGDGPNILELMEAGKKIDPSRDLWMYGGNNFWIDYKDMVGPRYWKPLAIKNLAEGKVLKPGDNRPSFMDEYLAATGNGLGGLDEYWKFIWKYPRLTGGAIWDWVSPGARMPVILTHDASPLKNDPAIMGRPEIVPGKTGKALKLSGHDDWLEFYNHPDLDINGTELTIEFRIKPEENLQPNTFLTKGSHQFGIFQPDAKTIEFYVQADDRFSLNIPIPQDWYNNWHHLAGIYTGDKLEVYIDYIKAGEAPANGAIRSTPHPLCIGRNAEEHTGGEFSGRLSVCTIDDVRVYNKAVAISELRGQAGSPDRSALVASIDFENIYKAGEFYSTGLGGNTYGVVWADRSIQPELYQVKKSAQPVLFEAVNIEKGLFRITNRHNFTNLNELSANWEIQAGEKLIAQDVFLIDCLPGMSTDLKLPLDWSATDASDDQWITISFSLKGDKIWAGAGHEIAWEQFQLPGKPVSHLTENIPPSRVTVEENEEEVIIEGTDFKYVIDVKSGSFASLFFRGTQLLAQPGFDLAVWRIPTANDWDSWGSRSFKLMNFTPGLGNSMDNQLRTLGLNKLTHEVYSVKAEVLETGQAKVSFEVYTIGSSLESGFEEHREYFISGAGSITMNHKIIPLGNMPLFLPRMGIQVFLSESFNNIEWYGRGPFETYPDRKTGARTGIWSSTVDKEYVPYLIPQDHGNKTDVRWFRISNDQNTGLIISGSELLNISVHSHTTDNLTRAVYPFQLRKAGFVTMNVDYEVTGVGSNAVRTLAKYKVMPSVKDYTLKIEPFSR